MPRCRAVALLLAAARADDRTCAAPRNCDASVLDLPLFADRRHTLAGDALADTDWVSLGQRALEAGDARAAVQLMAAATKKLPFAGVVWQNLGVLLPTRPPARPRPASRARHARLWNSPDSWARPRTPRTLRPRPRGVRAATGPANSCASATWTRFDCCASTAVATRPYPSTRPTGAPPRRARRGDGAPRVRPDARLRRPPRAARCATPRRCAGRLTRSGRVSARRLPRGRPWRRRARRDRTRRRARLRRAGEAVRTEAPVPR